MRRSAEPLKKTINQRGEHDTDHGRNYAGDETDLKRVILAASLISAVVSLIFSTLFNLIQILAA